MAIGHDETGGKEGKIGQKKNGGLNGSLTKGPIWKEKKKRGGGGGESTREHAVQL